MSSEVQQEVQRLRAVARYARKHILAMLNLPEDRPIPAWARNCALGIYLIYPTLWELLMALELSAEQKEESDA